MKDGLRQIVGKTISSVIVAKNHKSPENQVFLIFEDGSYFEFWGPEFSCAGGVEPGGLAQAAIDVEKLGGTVLKVYVES